MLVIGSSFKVRFCSGICLNWFAIKILILAKVVKLVKSVLHPKFWTLVKLIKLGKIWQKLGKIWQKLGKIW